MLILWISSMGKQVLIFKNVVVVVVVDLFSNIIKTIKWYTYKG